MNYDQQISTKGMLSLKPGFVPETRKPWRWEASGSYDGNSELPVQLSPRPQFITSPTDSNHIIYHSPLLCSHARLLPLVRLLDFNKSRPSNAHYGKKRPHNI